MKKRVVIISIILFGLFMLIAIGALVGIAMIFNDRSSNSFSISDNKVGIIEISGLIDDAGKYNTLIKRAVDNSSIKAIVLRINSPGGAVGSSQEIFQEVTAARKKGKIVVVSMENLGASGAYYIACGADKIVANPGTLTGSIGVIIEFWNWQGLMNDKLGLKFYNIKSGKFKDTGSADRPMTEEEKAYIQDVINNVYLQFLNAVVDGRQNAIREILAKKKMSLPDPGQPVENLKKMDLKKIENSITYSEITAYIKPYAEGNVYSGLQAYQTGFVDELGNLDTAIKLAGKLSGIQGEPVTIEIKPRDSSMVQKLFGEAGEALSPLKPNGVSLQYVLR